MQLSAPIFVLKGRAKTMARIDNVPLHQALDRIAKAEGFASWSLLMSQASTSPGQRLFNALSPGDLLLLAARPSEGKTLLGLELTILAMKQGVSGRFFSLEYNESDINDRFAALGEDRSRFQEFFSFDNSDAISADYLMEQLSTAEPGTMVVIDYLQLLDQKRSNPPLMEQVRALKTFATTSQLIIVFISQIDRAYERSTRRRPDIGDIRLPNPLDLSLFNKTCILSNGEVEIASV